MPNIPVPNSFTVMVQAATSVLNCVRSLEIFQCINKVCVREKSQTDTGSIRPVFPRKSLGTVDCSIRPVFPGKSLGTVDCSIIM